jgi:hypothetical protein
MKSLRVPLLVAVAASAVIALVGKPAQAQGNGPYQYFPVTPCRVFDTRQVSSQTTGNPLSNPGPYDFRVQSNCGVPSGAKAVTINCTVVSPTAQGDLRLYPVGAPYVVVATLAYGAGEPALANGAIVPLGTVVASTDKDLRTVIGMNGGPGTGTIHLIVDVTGYFQ